MKKKILIGTLAIVLLVVVGVVAIILIGNSGTSSNKEGGTSLNEDIVDSVVETTEKELFSLSNFEEFSKFASNNNFEVYYFDDDATAEVVGFEFLKSSSDMTVYFDGEKKIEKIKIYSQLCDISTFSSDDNGNITEEIFYDECCNAIENFADVFDVQYTQNLQLTNYDGTVCYVGEMKDMSSFINEEAYVSFALRDKVGHYYVMHICKFDNMIESNIMKYYDVKAYLDYFADISLYEEEN